MFRVSIEFALALLIEALSVTPVIAGPPFRTDDPEPVAYRHWEVYLGSQGSFDRGGASVTAPHFEINYGLVPDVQIHLIAPLEYVATKGARAHYGYGDTELGVKYRFIHETDSLPQAGIFPLLELPSGDKDKGLGGGRVQAFIPLWLQKSWGPYTTYGGAGYWIHPGSGNKDYWFFGWELQREISEKWTLGAEVFHATPSEPGGEGNTGFNFGVIVNLSDLHHVLVSAGRDFSGSNHASFYAAYQLTFGP